MSDGPPEIGGESFEGSSPVYLGAIHIELVSPVDGGDIQVVIDWDEDHLIAIQALGMLEMARDAILHPPSE